MAARVPGEPPPDLSRQVEEVRTRVYPELAGVRLDQALRRLLPWRSRSSIQRLIKEGRVSLLPPHGDPSRRLESARAALKVQAEDVLVVRLPRRVVPPPIEDLALPAELPVVYEDAWLVAFDKPAGLTVHPVGRRLEGTLINLLHQRYRNLEDPARDVVPRLCHRLDRETSGVILVATDELAHSDVRKQFEAQTVAKSYLALVEGRVEREEDWIDARLGPDRGSRVRLKMAVTADGLEAITRYAVRQRGRDAEGRHLTLVECFPRTGRQHQIRVHLAWIGHPVVGDKLYGPDEGCFLQAVHGVLGDSARQALRLPRHALHSHTLRLRHPLSGQDLTITAPLPADMGDLLAACIPA